MRLVLSALILALPAQAQDAAYWGGTGCVLVPVEGQAHIAEARCVNLLTGYQPWTEADMTAGGLTVHLSVLHGPDRVPDEFTVTPPDGFVAVPPVLVLDEDQVGTILLYRYLGF